ncbi:MAG: glycosyltransferase family 2 protein [Chitinophagia bacterium]|nr:glycosyltransferase family 2 protein [Chitinophagia bacterium]
MRPVTLPAYLKHILSLSNEQKTALIRQNYPQLRKTGTPRVSVVIPAYNEENNILSLLTSLAANQTDFAVEVIVVNNNSVDKTEELVRQAGVTCVNEYKKGVVAARTAGLMAASGEFILNADADSIYPPGWIAAMIPPLANQSNVALTYGRFAFVPSGTQSRAIYCLYETLADILRWYKKHFKEEGMNVYGCNSGFRKAQCLEVDTYAHPPGANEDGWLAVKLRNKGFGKLHYVGHPSVIVWTVDRHLQNDGGLWKAFLMRIRNAFSKG